MKAWRIGAVVLLSALSLQSYAQQSSGSMVMSLEECLAYAKEHSITLKQAELNVKGNEIGETNAKNAFLPSVSGSISQSLSSNPFSSIDTSGSYGGSYGVNLSMPIYSGGENRLNVEQSKVSTTMSTLAVAELESTLEMNITKIYVEILYAIEQIKVAENSIALSQKNIELGKVKLEVGSINETDYAQFETALASSQYSLVLAQTSLNSKYIELKHMLEISDQVTLQVDPSDLSEGSIMQAVPSLDDVYAVALETRPEISSSILNIESAELDEKIAKSGYLPTVSLSAGIGTSHSNGSDYTFSEQIKNSFSNSIGVSVSIPIFNKFYTKNSVILAQYDVQSAELSLTEEQKSLYQTIESLHTNATNAQAMYVVSESRLKALEKSLALVTQQYEVGMKNIIELLTEQDDYSQASQEFLESKYTLILNKALLEYYKTGIIKI